ncbi:MAG: hypothetical protein E6R08_00395 [Nevskiaceae bacterium]|nr:MAG: hypothetical protein E6R08_00395 [Nevskiaceae bacterium]
MFDLTAKPLQPTLPPHLFALTLLSFFSVSMMSVLVPDLAGPIAYAADHDFFGLAVVVDLIDSLVDLLLQFAA